MSRLLLLFVVVSAIELVLLIEIGQRIGTLPTLGLIVVTGALGAYLARPKVSAFSAECARRQPPTGFPWRR